MRLPFRAPAIAASLLLALLPAAAAWAASPADAEQTTEQRRQARLVAHLKRLQRPEDWLIVRKLFSSDRSRQLNALSNCPLPENEWPWHLSSHHLEQYRFTVDFIPVNMDADPEEENLIVIRSDPADVNYITFCLVDDAKRGRTPLASYSDLSRGRPITYQITDLTGDGGSELIVNTRVGTPGNDSDAVRIIKSDKDRRFRLVWFARLHERFDWPAHRNGDADRRIRSRRENLRARVRLHFNGPGNPVTILLRGEREYEETVSFLRGNRRLSQTSVQKLPFEELWSWSPDQFRFVRVSTDE